MNIVSVRNLSFSYQANNVLKDVTLDVRQGEYVGIVGPNGAGKTTFIKTILGLLNPYKGDVRLFGQERSAFRDWYKIGYLPQKPLSMNPLFPATVKEIVSLGLLSTKRLPKRFTESDEADIDRALEEMRILAIKHALVGELSGGQQQRVLAARAVVNEPELLILDEPVTALDPAVSRKFMETIQQLNKHRNVTVLLITHDLANIGKYATKMLYIDRKVIFYGTFRDVCLSEDITAYFGEYLQHVMCHQHEKEKV
jgi:zinc transport system ATP-binding protein